MEIGEEGIGNRNRERFIVRLLNLDSWK
jgi:hypothetical protein